MEYCGYAKLKWKLGIAIILASLSYSCTKDNKKVDAEVLIKEWAGKQIYFPDNYTCRWEKKDTSLCTCLINKEYKVLFYVDSTGCTSCKLKLVQWKNLISKVDTMDIIKRKLSFLFFLHPKDKKELMFLLKRDGLGYPVFLDTANAINKLNHFPTDPAYQCFLLDRHNKVLAIGNPALNPKVWELYKRIISGGKTEAKQERTTTVEAEKREYDYGNIKAGKGHPMEFTLKNTGTSPLIITHVSASCGCTAVDWEKRPVSPRSSTRIKVEMKPDNPGTFTKTITVYCNVESGVLNLTVKGSGVK